MTTLPDEYQPLIQQLFETIPSSHKICKKMIQKCMSQKLHKELSTFLKNIQYLRNLNCRIYIDIIFYLQNVNTCNRYFKEAKIHMVSCQFWLFRNAFKYRMWIETVDHGVMWCSINLPAISLLTSYFIIFSI